MDGVYLPLGRLRKAFSVLIEGCLLVFAFVVASAARFHGDPFKNELLLPKALVSALLIQICLYYTDLYEDHAMRRRIEIFLRFGQAFMAAILLLSLVYYAVPELSVGRGILSIYLPLGLVLLLAWRALYLWLAGREALADNVLIVGTGPSARLIAQEMLRLTPLGFRIVGFIGEQRAEVGKHIVNPAVIGVGEELQGLVQRHRVNLILVALDDRRGKMPVAELLTCRLAGVRVEEAPAFYERLTGRIMVKNLRPSWLVFSQGFNKPRLLRNSKRFGELVVAALLIALLSPLLALIALLIKLDDPGPVLYGQTRVGEKGRVFTLYKFRSMKADAEAVSGPVWASRDGDPRITRVGRWLRKARLDELPQLVNVVRGEMSFVGPRPERPHFIEHLNRVIPYYNERHSVKPGITGWAQIKFGYGSTIEEAEDKLEFDLYYIKHMSLIFDLGILLDTLKVVVVGKGAR